jgi:serine/threonine protein kinase
MAMNPAASECLTPQEIQELVYATAPAEGESRASAHLRICARCREELEEQRRFAQLRNDFAQLGAARPGAQPPELPGFDDYRWLGRGGEGDVWRARDVQLGRLVALKVLRLDQFGPQEQHRLRREAEIMAGLAPHTHRVQVFQVAEHEGQLVLVLSYVGGGSLDRRGQLPWREAVRYLHDVALGLADLHRQGLQHRDIKPGNFLWDAVNDRAVLADYGLADRAGQRPSGRTPGYAAPEVVTGQPEFASDVFALAVSGYRLMTGRMPFAAADETEMVRRMQAGLPSPDDNLAGVPRAVQALLRAGLQAEARRRPSLDAFREDLRRLEMYVLAEEVEEQVRTSAVRLSVAVATAPGPRQPFIQVLQRTSGLVATEDRGVVEAATGHLIRYEVRTDTEGYLTVLNFGAEGKVEMFLSVDGQTSERIVPGETKKRTTALAPPVGKEYTAVIWTRQPTQLSGEEWHERIKGAGERGQVPVQAEIARADDWTAVVVPVVQRAGIR